MSNQPPKDTSLGSTKQMLDELDALMEKMLALPVNDPEETPAFPQEVVKKPALSAKLTFLQPPVMAPKPAPPAPAPPTLMPPMETVEATHPVLNPPHLPLASDPEPMIAPPLPTPLTNEVMQPSYEAQLAPLLANVPDEEPLHAPGMGFLPLVWINEVFDSATMMLGGAGEWVRGITGRTLLGLAGIACMVLAVGWFLKDWLGWN